MTSIHENLEPVPFTPPEPYRGGRFLGAPDEINPCNISGQFSTRNTVLRDSDGDGRNDCFVSITTTTQPPETQPPETQPEPDPGDGDDPEGPTPPPTTSPPAPAPTTPLPPPTEPAPPATEANE